MIQIRNEKELAKIRKAGRILAQVFKEIKKQIKAGVDTAVLDQLAEKLLLKKGAVPAFKGYRNYKYATCISVNEEIVHGIPGRRKLKDGDVVGVDIGAVVSGYYADMAKTFVVGKPNRKIKKLIAGTKEALKSAINQAQAGRHLGDISAAIERCAKQTGFQVVRDLFGHGIGESLHEDPLIPNFGNPGEGPKLKPGMVFAIEPMLNIGGHEIETLDDGWTIVTRDRSISAHFEHTIVIKEGKAEILTDD